MAKCKWLLPMAVCLFRQDRLWSGWHKPLSHSPSLLGHQIALLIKIPCWKCVVVGSGLKQKLYRLVHELRYTVNPAILFHVFGEIATLVSI
jgi:hypothetical protein